VQFSALVSDWLYVVALFLAVCVFVALLHSVGFTSRVFLCVCECVCVLPFAFLYNNHNPNIDFLFVPF